MNGFLLTIGIASNVEVWQPIALASDSRSPYAYSLSYYGGESIVHRIDADGTVTVIARKWGRPSEFGVIAKIDERPLHPKQSLVDSVWLSISEIYGPLKPAGEQSVPGLNVSLVALHFVRPDYLWHMLGYAVDRPGNRSILSAAVNHRGKLCTLTTSKGGQYVDVMGLDDEWSSSKIVTKFSYNVLAIGSRPGYYVVARSLGRDDNGPLTTHEILEIAPGLSRSTKMGEYKFEFDGLFDPVNPRSGIDCSLASFDNGKSVLWINGAQIARFRFEKGTWKKQPPIALEVG